MNRRKFLAFLAAGGVVTATGLWLPGQKLISIPKKPLFINELNKLNELNRRALRLLEEKMYTVGTPIPQFPGSKYVYKTFYIER